MNTGNVTFSGNVTTYSDIRFKDNVNTIPNAVEKVKTVSGITYETKDTKEKRTCVIAQEIEKVLPEAVETDDDGYKTVAYGNMVGLLIKAIKEQQDKIDGQQMEIDDLKSRLNKIGA
jgi:hypothetical protein